MQQARVVDLGTLVREAEGMLRRVIGEDVELELHLAEDPGSVKVDPGQLEQVLLHLAVNARHAMPRGGVLTIATSTTDRDPLALDGVPEPAVSLAVTDTGPGMDAETRKLIFEPSFTISPKGEGPLLGLATVANIVRQSGGRLEVDSEPGHGTTYRIDLPCVDETPEPLARPATTRPGPRGHETVLLVEDQASLRDMVRETLELLGYRVLVAAHGEAGLAMAGRHRGRLDLLVTDIVMPRLDGSELARRLTADRPGLRVLYISGHGPDLVARRGIDPSAVLEKPVTTRALSLRVRDALDRPAPAAAEGPAGSSAKG
jgi:CheY-like chemotaxis protein